MPYKESVTIDDVLALLNELLEKDPSAIVSLVEHRVFCNRAVSEHPTVQVVNKDGVDYVGMLGILNGLFGANEQNRGVLAVEIDEKDSKIHRFIRLDRLPKDSADNGNQEDREHERPVPGPALERPTNPE